MTYSNVRFVFTLFLVSLFAVACAPTATPPPVPATPSRTPLLPTPVGTPATIVTFPTPTLQNAPDAVTAVPSAVTVALPPTPTTEATAPLLTTTLVPPASRAALAVSPVVQLLSPISNTQISVSQTFNVVAFATDDSGIARIELYDDNVIVRTEIAPSPAPAVFSAILPWTPTAIGTHALRVVAYDTQNHASTPDEAAIPVTTDVRRPSSIIVYPIGIPQVDFGSVFQIYGVATDEVGVTQLDLIVDNQPYNYITAQNLNGQPAFPFIFTWNALAPGQHTFLVRAHDNQDQTTDSAPLKILVVDSHTPALSLAFDRTNALVNEPITITATALDASGIQRIELLNGKDIFSTNTSLNPARQTSFSTQILWTSPNPGDYKISARAYNANGNSKDTPAQIISVLTATQSTPTLVPTPTPTRTRAPRVTPTARPQPPVPPSAEIVSPTDRFTGTSPLRITFSGQGHAELDRIELWGYYQGQLAPQLICVIDSKAATQKSAQCEWNAPTAGAIDLFAQTIDIYRQIGRSPMVSGYLAAPSLPPPTLAPLAIAGKWNAAVATGPITVTLRQNATAVRGDMRVAGIDTLGRVTVGALKADHLTFSADFTPLAVATPLPNANADTPTPVAATATPNANAVTMDFDCVVDVSISTLTCTFKDSRGRTGSAFFRRDSNP